jgi:nucleotide-binding universal stress UspA family protein
MGLRINFKPIKKRTMKTIIFPTDFSKNADRAMLFAVAIATALKARIIAVNAFDLPYSQNVMSTSLLDIMKQTSEHGLEEVAKKLGKTGIEFETRSMMGNPIRVVKELSKYYQNSMVVMGTKGASGIEEVLIGSNAASILHSVDVPVMAIPQDSAFKGIKKILYASDFVGKKLHTALGQLAIFAKAMNAEVLILHVQEDDQSADMKTREIFENVLAAVPHSFHIVKPVGGNVEKTILDFGREKDADMIALLSRKYGFIEGLFHSSMTSKVAFHTKCPLLALHEQ